MKKAVDTFAIERALDSIKGALLLGWYASAAGIMAALWFFPITQDRVQVFAALGAIIWYSLLSVWLTKVGQIKMEMKTAEDVK